MYKEISDQKSQTGSLGGDYRASLRLGLVMERDWASVMEEHIVRVSS